MLFIIITACIILFLLILLFTSRSRVVRIYDKYSQVRNNANITGKELAFISKQQLELHLLNFSLIKGKLTDAYSPKQKTLFMSEEICNNPSIASVAIVAHELGHAMQDQTNDPLFRLNRILGTIARLTSRLILPLLLFGGVFWIFMWPTPTIGKNMCLASAIIFCVQAAFKLLTIPVEYDASKRALKYLIKYNLITNKEVPRVKKLLRVAAQTYIVALFDGIIVSFKKIGNLFTNRR